MSWGRARLLQVCALAVSATSGGCMKMTSVGVAQGSLTTTRRVHVACIEDRGGGDGELLLGTADGRPAVQPSGVKLGVTPVMVHAETVDGVKAYAAQECLDNDAPLCDTSLYVARGKYHFFMYWTQQYPASAARPTSPTPIIAEASARGLFKILAALDLDAPTVAEVSRLAEARGARRTAQWVKFYAGAALKDATPKLGLAEGAARDGADRWMKDAVNLEFQVDESERAALEKNPKVGAVFSATRLARHGGFPSSVCIGPTANR